MGVLLEDLAWPQAEAVLGPETTVVLPLGAAAKQHGHHLRLDNDLRLALHLRDAVLDLPIVVTPPLAFHHFPAFARYPGSVSLRPETARDLVVDIVRSYARFGPRRFYVLNTGLSTVPPLADAARELAKDGVSLRWSDWHGILSAAAQGRMQQPLGSHADEVETSLMLHLEPDRVDMTRATRELAPWQAGGFQREAGQPGTHSPSGAWGDATLATAEKGRLLWDAVVAAVRADLNRPLGT